MNFFGALLAGFLSGVAGAMGLGGGSVLLIYLTVFAGVPQLQAQGINLLFFIPIALVSTVLYVKQGLICFQKVVPMALFGALGTILGNFILSAFEPEFLRKIFGILVFGYGLVTLFAKPKTKF